LVYLSTKNLALPKGRAKTLLPKFIGLYTVVEVYHAASTVILELPPELTAQRIHPTFQESLIQAHVPNNDHHFPHHNTATSYDFSAAKEPEWFVDEILAHQWMSQDSLEFQVKWTLGDITWEPLAKCKELWALDKYLELCRVKQPCNWPHKTHSSCD